MSQPPASRPALTGWRRSLFRIALAVLGPLLVLGVIEGGLRLAGYGYPTRFFVKAEDNQTLTTNRRFNWRFQPRETATQPYPVLLPVEKPPGTIRIFVLGESAAQGTPAPAFGFARILEIMLAGQFPERRFEVVNAAMRGINSHVVLPIARDCARHAPDLFLVYMGNNETIGLYAPESGKFNITPYLRLLRAGQWIKGTKVAQLLDDLLRRIGRRGAERPEQDMALFRRARLAADDPRREAVYDNFRANLEDICRVTQASGAKLVVSTVAGNLKDFPPLASLHRSNLASNELAIWEAACARGTNAEGRGLLAEALTNYVDAARADDHFAELHFRLARCALATGDLERGRRHFGLARDWDALQFRSDSRLNQIIRDTIASAGGPGLALVDAERALADHPTSEHGVPGARFFHEHVHLTFDGDYLLARTFFPAVIQALGLSNAVASASRPLPSRQDCAEALAFTEWDEISVSAAMLRMTAKAPFLDQLEHAERQARAEQSLAERGQAFQKLEGFKRAVQTYLAATRRRPGDWQIHMNFGTLLSDMGNKGGAAKELSEAVKFMPVYPALRMMLGQACWSGRREDALWQFREILRIDPSHAPARDALAQADRRRRS